MDQDPSFLLLYMSPSWNIRKPVTSKKNWHLELWNRVKCLVEDGLITTVEVFKPCTFTFSGHPYPLLSLVRESCCHWFHKQFSGLISPLYFLSPNPEIMQETVIVQFTSTVKRNLSVELHFLCLLVTMFHVL